jgi:multiple sugar transport system substrate-binding protein
VPALRTRSTSGRARRSTGRRLGCLFAAVPVVAGASAAAGLPMVAASASQQVHLTMWQQWGGGHEEQELRTAIAQYEKLHPNVTITETPVTNDAKILASITGGNPPDIVDLGTSAVLGGWASEGAVEPLTSLVKAAHLNLKAYVPAGLDAVTVNGTLYGLPFMNFLVGLLYNKKLFAAAGLNPKAPPTTTEQLYADAVKLTKVSGGKITQLGFAPNYPGPSQGQVCPLESYGWLFGGSWYSSSGKPTPDTSQNLAALTWEKSFFTKFGATDLSNFVQSAGAYLTAGDPFESGKLAMMLDGPWTLQYIKANNPSLDPYIGVAKFPAPAGKSQHSGTTFLDTNAQIIPRGSKNVQAAFDFIKWETTNAQLTSEFANTVANIPQLQHVPSFPLEKDSRFLVFEQESKSKNAHTWGQSKISSQYSTQLCQAQDSALIGGSSPAAALKALASEVGG